MGGPQTSDDKKLLGVLIMLAGQAVQAMQNVVEEKLLHGSECDETFVVAVEGFWGLLLCTGIFMPLAKFLPGEDGEGVHEDVFPEDFYMLTHSGKILGLVVFFRSSRHGVQRDGLDHHEPHSVNDSQRGGRRPNNVCVDDVSSFISCSSIIWRACWYVFAG